MKPEMIQQYKAKGYTVIRGLFSKHEILNVKKDIDSVFGTYCDCLPSDEMIFKLFKEDFQGFHGCAHAAQSLLSLSRLQTDDRIIGVLNELGLEFPAINTRPLVSISSRHTALDDTYWKVPPHQDWPSTQGSINGVTVWMPLVDVTEDLGPLECSPGSHLKGYIPHEDIGVPILRDNFQFDPIPMNVGDALFFNWLTVHRSGNNISNQIRWTMHFRYNDLKEPFFIEHKYPRHRIDRRKEGILYPGFPSPQQMVELCGTK